MDHTDDLNWLDWFLSSRTAASRDVRSGNGLELFTADFLSRPPTVTSGALDIWARGVVS